MTDFNLDLDQEDIDQIEDYWTGRAAIRAARLRAGDRVPSYYSFG